MAVEARATAQATVDNRHPKGFWFIFWGELAERASFYGMKTLLLLYMINILGYADEKSGQVVSLFTAACYVLPILGGYIADHYLGKFKTIIYFAIPYIFGHIVLGTFTNEVGLYTALLLLAGGSGAVKPNISTLMGLMYEKEGKSHLLTQAFSWFYMAVNIGAAATTLTLPFVRDKYGYGAAFMAPTILMVVALGIFYYGKKYYPVEEAKRAMQKGRTPEQRKIELATLGRLSGLFILVAFFWSLFDQSATTWTLFARDHINLPMIPFLDRVLPPDAIQSANPFLIVLLTPLAAWVWSRTDTETRRLSSPRKMLIGFFLVALCMGMMSMAGYMSVESKVSISWQIIGYVLMTAGELCISVVGLQLAFEEAPNSMKSMITGIWLCMVSLGNVLASQLVSIYAKTTPGNYFGLMTAMIVVVMILFYFVGRRFEHGSAKAV